jgi:hypothetical protein
MWVLDPAFRCGAGRSVSISLRTKPYGYSRVGVCPSDAGFFFNRESIRTFLEGVVAFPPVLAGRDREALPEVANRLSVELGYTEGEELPGAHSTLGIEEAMAGILNSEDELLVAGVRRGLARVAAALGGEGSEAGTSGRAVRAALDGAEMAMRGELVRGKDERLPAMMPSFVFLVALTVVDQDRALELSRRTEELLERTE